jgi:glycosyltransferase involved in cell wall biosynthesis
VTVVVVFHRRADAVARTLRSLQEQTLRDFVAVVIDDGSPDETFSAMLAFKGDKRFDLRRQANRGFTATMAASCAEVRTPFLAVMGAGDACHPERLAAQVALLEADPSLVAVGCGIENVDEVDGRRWSVIPPRTRLAGPRAESAGISHGEVMYRTEAYRRAGGYRTAFDVGQFSDLLRRMTLLGDVGFDGRVLYTRYLRSDGVSSDPHKLARRRMLAALSATSFERRPEFRDGSFRAWSADQVVPPDAIDQHGILTALYLPRSVRIARALALESLHATAIGRRRHAWSAAWGSLAARPTVAGLAAAGAATMGSLVRSAAMRAWVARELDRRSPPEDRLDRVHR